MKRILTGLQPTGVITLGNYIGAIKQMKTMQEQYDSFIFIADLHAITIEQDKEKLKENTKNLLALYLACGIDPNKNTIYLQSQNLYHTNLSWLLECNTYFGELSRMHQFKEKSQKHASFSVGLLTYPVLMAADILLYDAVLVPTGQDQKQHVEITRDIAIRFNKKYGDTFVVPEPFIPETGCKIMDLLEPKMKMSKSTENQKGVIRLLDSPTEIRKKIMSATTDSEMLIKYDEENKAGISNLMNIYSALTNKTIQEIETEMAGFQYGAFKSKVADVVVELIADIQTKYAEILNSAQIDEILANGQKKTTEIAKAKYEEARTKMGFY